MRQWHHCLFTLAATGKPSHVHNQTSTITSPYLEIHSWIVCIAVSNRLSIAMKCCSCKTGASGSFWRLWLSLWLKVRVPSFHKAFSLSQVDLLNLQRKTRTTHWLYLSREKAYCFAIPHSSANDYCLQVQYSHSLENTHIPWGQHQLSKLCNAVRWTTSKQSPLLWNASVCCPQWTLPVHMTTRSAKAMQVYWLPQSTKMSWPESPNRCRMTQQIILPNMYTGLPSKSNVE